MSVHDIGGWTAAIDERVGTGGDEVPIYDESGGVVAACWQMGEDFDGENDDANMKANAERIAACVNACQGINPEAVPLLIEALDAMMRVQSKRRHPLGAPDEGIATMAAEAMDKARRAMERAGVKP